MAVDQFLMIDGVKGEAQDDKHKEEIDVLAWSWGMSQSGTTHMGSGSGAGKVSVQDISVTKYVDKSTPILMQACCDGRHFKNALLTIRKAGGEALEYIKVKMTDVIVTSISTGGSGGEDRLTENVSLNFGAVETTYTEQTPEGTPAAEVLQGWDMAANKSLV